MNSQSHQDQSESYKDISDLHSLIGDYQVSGTSVSHHSMTQNQYLFSEFIKTHQQNDRVPPIVIIVDDVIVIDKPTRILCQVGTILKFVGKGQIVIACQDSQGISFLLDSVVVTFDQSLTQGPHSLFTLESGYLAMNDCVCVATNDQSQDYKRRVFITASNSCRIEIQSTQFKNFSQILHFQGRSLIFLVDKVEIDHQIQEWQSPRESGVSVFNIQLTNCFKTSIVMSHLIIQNVFQAINIEMMDGSFFCEIQVEISYTQIRNFSSAIIIRGDNSYHTGAIRIYKNYLNNFEKSGITIKDVQLKKLDIEHNHIEAGREGVNIVNTYTYESFQEKIFDLLPINFTENKIQGSQMVHSALLLEGLLCVEIIESMFINNNGYGVIARFTNVEQLDQSQQLTDTLQDIEYNFYTISFFKSEFNDNKNAGLCVIFDESQMIYVNLLISMSHFQKNGVGIELTGRGGSFRQVRNKMILNKCLIQGSQRHALELDSERSCQITLVDATLTKNDTPDLIGGFQGIRSQILKLNRFTKLDGAIINPDGNIRFYPEFYSLEGKQSNCILF